LKGWASVATYDVSHPRWDGLDRLSAVDQALANVNGGSGSLPGGGTSGQVLEKLSGADGDAGWATPLSPSSDATISGLWNYTQAPTVNGVPVATGSGGIPTYEFIANLGAAAPASGTIASIGAIGANSVSMFGRGGAYSFVVNQSCAVFLGCATNTVGSAGALIRFGVWLNDRTVNNVGNAPGTLLADLGTVAADATTGIKWSPSSVALTAGTVYWAAAIEQGDAATHPIVKQCSGGLVTSLIGVQGSGVDSAVSVRLGDTGALPSNPSVVTYDGFAGGIFLKVV